ncbi:MAG: hypothetical protein ACOYT4_02290 [Nanoarchaeota archaeon]
MIFNIKKSGDDYFVKYKDKQEQFSGEYCNCLFQILEINKKVNPLEKLEIKIEHSSVFPDGAVALTKKVCELYNENFRYSLAP